MLMKCKTSSARVLKLIGAFGVASAVALLAPSSSSAEDDAAVGVAIGAGVGAIVGAAAANSAYAAGAYYGQPDYNSGYYNGGYGYGYGYDGAYAYQPGYIMDDSHLSSCVGDLGYGRPDYWAC
ncbi:MAG TPA: hypothetical protein VFL51_04590 [Pseudolabrys sp.]|nr:hypothetical protein [Pseudolabrys sp.]